MPATRRLAAILAADVAGYSRLMGEDEEGTLAALKAIHRDLGDPKIKEHRGRIVKTTGDGLLVEFSSVVDAVRCAVEVQQGMAARNAAVPEARRIEFRMGINLGDIILDEGDIFGDGVNIAARLEALAKPGGICLSGIVHDQVRDRLDLAFEDIGEQALKNIARPMRVFRVTLTRLTPAMPALGTLSRSAGEGRPRRASDGVGEGNSPALALPDKPSIAVLPFQNLSGDPEQEYFADGMVEEIITALSRIRWLFVIARNSSFTYKGPAIDVKRVGRELGVRYVLEGSVRKGGQRVRITAQLIDASNGAHLWADRFDGSLEDVFDLQDKVAISVAGVIEPALQAAETARSATRSTSDLTAYDLYLRALANFPWFGKGVLFEACGLFDQAIARDPDYAPALAWAAICHFRYGAECWAEDPAASRRKAIALAERALALTDDDSGVLANVAHVLGLSGEDLGTAIALVDRSVALNPSHARGWYVSGLVHCVAGRYDEAITHIETSLRLSPRGYQFVPRYALGMAYFYSRRFDQAAEMLAMSVREMAASPHAHRLLAACYAHMGRLDDARAIVARLRAITPDVIPIFFIHRMPEQRELLLSGLRLAMGETDEALELSG
jgi:adenylate cyclase